MFKMVNNHSSTLHYIAPNNLMQHIFYIILVLYLSTGFMLLNIAVCLSNSVNETSTEDRLVPGSKDEQVLLFCIGIQY